MNVQIVQNYRVHLICCFLPTDNIVVPKTCCLNISLTVRRFTLDVRKKECSFALRSINQCNLLSKYKHLTFSGESKIKSPNYSKRQATSLCRQTLVSIHLHAFREMVAWKFSSQMNTKTSAENSK